MWKFLNIRRHIQKFKNSRLQPSMNITAEIYCLLSIRAVYCIDSNIYTRRLCWLNKNIVILWFFSFWWTVSIKGPDSVKFRAGKEVTNTDTPYRDMSLLSGESEDNLRCAASLIYTARSQWFPFWNIKTSYISFETIRRRRNDERFITRTEETPSFQNWINPLRNQMLLDGAE